MTILKCFGLAICCALMFSKNSLAEQPRVLHPNDFAYGGALEAPPGSPVYRLALPEDIYLGVTRADLGDLRVFNSQDDVVPHELSRFQPVSRIISTGEDLPIFRIDGKPSISSTGHQVQVSEDSSGKVTSVRFSGGGKTNASESAYLIDARKFSKPLYALNFVWSSARQNQIIPLQIETSTDLSSWRSLASAVVLARLSYQGQAVEQSQVYVAPQRVKFIKITAPSDAGVSFSKVTGEFTSGEIVPVDKHWATVHGNIDSKDTSLYLFDSGGCLPAASLRINLPEPNTLARITVRSRAKQDASWQNRYSGLVYRLSEQGVDLNSPAQDLNTTINDRYWAIEVSGKDAHLGPKAPELQLGWIPHELIWLARGTPPFRLAYGSASVGPPDFGAYSISSVVVNSMGKSTSAMNATFGTKLELGGPSQLVPAPVVKPVPWKQWLLWAVLSIFLLALGLMTWRLGRDLKLGSK